MRILANVRGRNTKGEVNIRTELRPRGFCYRIKVQTMPSKPNIELLRYRAGHFVQRVLLVWHSPLCSAGSESAGLLPGEDRGRPSS